MKIDSFTTLTPLDCFKFIPESFLEKWYLVNLESGELVEEKLIPYFFDAYGVKFRVSVVKLFGVQHLRITWTSKMIGKDYFEGLNIVTFRKAFDFVFKNLELVVTWNDFFNNSSVLDIDLCLDFVESDHEFASRLRSFSAIPSVKYFRDSGLALDSFNVVGAQFCTRRDASVKFPFVKWYSKRLELMERSGEFFGFLVSEGVNVPENLRRVEITLKNARHIKSVLRRCNFGFAKLDLYTLLSLSVDRIEKIMQVVIDRYDPFVCYERDMVRREPVDISPTDFLLGSLIYNLMQEGWSFKNCVSLLKRKNGISDNSRSRIKQRCKKALKYVLERESKAGLVIKKKDAFFT